MERGSGSESSLSVGREECGYSGGPCGNPIGGIRACCWGGTQLHCGAPALVRPLCSSAHASLFLPTTSLQLSKSRHLLTPATESPLLRLPLKDFSGSACLHFCLPPPTSSHLAFGQARHLQGLRFLTVPVLAGVPTASPHVHFTSSCSVEYLRRWYILWKTSPDSPDSCTYPSPSSRLAMSPPALLH